MIDLRTLTVIDVFIIFYELDIRDHEINHALEFTRLSPSFLPLLVNISFIILLKCTEKTPVLDNPNPEENAPQRLLYHTCNRHFRAIPEPSA
jgi:hypothetical protein